MAEIPSVCESVLSKFGSSDYFSHSIGATMAVCALLHVSTLGCTIKCESSNGSAESDAYEVRSKIRRIGSQWNSPSTCPKLWDVTEVSTWDADKRSKVDVDVCRAFEDVRLSLCRDLGEQYDLSRIEYQKPHSIIIK